MSLIPKIIIMSPQIILIIRTTLDVNKFLKVETIVERPINQVIDATHTPIIKRIAPAEIKLL